MIKHQIVIIVAIAALAIWLIIKRKGSSGNNDEPNK